MPQFNSSEGKLRVTFPARMDTQACQSANEEISGEIARFPLDVVFDLTGVEYVSSAFLRICMRAAKQKGEGFSVVNALPQVLMVFKIAAFDKLFSVSGVK